MNASSHLRFSHLTRAYEYAYKVVTNVLLGLLLRKLGERLDNLEPE